MEWIEVIKAIIYGIIEGITEWLPVSSTGHLILLERILPFNLSPEFVEMFRVVIQLGAILAIVLMYWSKIWPFRRLNTERGKIITYHPQTITLWLKIIFACLPAAVVGVLFDDQIDALFYNYLTVSVMLILVGIAFFLVENTLGNSAPTVTDLSGITWNMAFIIGLFQLMAAVFPGTSRSGATILGGIIIGMSRAVAAEFTFFLAIPVMFGASLLKLVKMNLHMQFLEVMVLLMGMVVSFLVSYYVVGMLMRYIKRHNFKPFGAYRIALGAVVLLAFGLFI